MGDVRINGVTVRASVAADLAEQLYAQAESGPLTVASKEVADRLMRASEPVGSVDFTGEQAAAAMHALKALYRDVPGLHEALEKNLGGVAGPPE